MEHNWKHRILGVSFSVNVWSISYGGAQAGILHQENIFSIFNILGNSKKYLSKKCILTADITEFLEGVRKMSME